MKPRAFTLIEVLVVFSILVLLAALLSPALASSREQARTVVCCANIRQLLLGLLNYEAEHQSLPYGFAIRGVEPPGGYQGNALYDGPGWWWFDYAGLIRHKSWMKTGETKILRCPSSRLGDAALNRDVLVGKYGVNRALCKTKSDIVETPVNQAFFGIPLATSSLPCPGSTLLLVDSGYSLICWWQATADPPAPLGDKYILDTSYIPGLAINKERDLWPGQACDAEGGRHAGKTVNIGFADGHSGRRKARELLLEKTEEGYTNTLLWHAQ
jgi:prepilin-type processing-associated H-X9-DG protein/prepilin-type N-terminal cleavage/methylation domain-containing protein